MNVSQNIRDLIIIFCCTLLIGLLISNFLLQLFYRNKTIDNDYVLAVQELYEINADSDDKIVFFGSSMGREGIDRQYFARTLEKYKIYNFSISSGKPSDFYLLFKRIRKKEDIKLAVIMLSPWVFEKKYTDDINDGIDIFTNLIFDPISVVRIINPKDINLRWFAKQAIVSAAPFYKYNEYVQKIIDQKNLSFWKLEQERSKPETWIQYKYSEDKPESYFSEEFKKESNYDEYRNANYYWDARKNIQAKGLGRLLSDFHEKSIPVIVIDMPVNPHKQKFYEEGLVANYLATINPFLGFARFVDYSLSYPKENFIDFNHLNAKGREQFSRDLRELMKTSYGF